MTYYILVNEAGYYLSRKNESLTTRHIQEAKWFLHKDYQPKGFVVRKLKLTIES